ncbi:MAG: diguanylate cyclase [Proteobacteria bacterium]|nr:diguanylate cyclase [Pseudomonadota bacterium]MDA1355496.1 diguanylate cyclase [Pseudomonadota bacterium]
MVTNSDVTNAARFTAGLPGVLDFVGADLAAHYPGALILINPHGHAEAINKQAEELSEELNGAQQKYLIALITRAAEAQATQTDFLVIGDSRASVTIELTVIPLLEVDSFLLLGKDITLEKNLRGALVESRRRYKELIECSSDFVWETDGHGRFVFVTALGALGYSANMLVGRSARSMVDRRKPVPEPFPFESRQPADRAEVWMRDSSGEPACLLVSSVPMTSEGRFHVGARGVCRDVTEARKRDDALAKIRLREAMFATMVRTIRDEVDPDRMLNTAARVLAEGFAAAACMIFRVDAKRHIRESASFGTAPEGPVKELMREVENGVSDLEFTLGSDEVRALTCPTRYQGRRNGVIFISRSDRRRWAPDERALLADVAERIGIAIQQIDAKDELLLLSRIDGLTDLFNRRAFVLAVEQSMAAHARSGDRAALFYVDLNNFKGVNDHYGHHQGDAALKMAAKIMTSSAERDDVVARIGGDEFALWLNACDEAGALERAASLAQSAKCLADFSENLPAPLGVSIGIAVFDPASNEAVDDLLVRADHAMYMAKRDPGREFSLALAAETVPPHAAQQLNAEQNDDAIR